MVDKHFREWACSLSGCDTRNTDAGTWICGIEWGGAEEGPNGLKNYYEEVLPGEISDGTYTPEHANYDWREHQKYTYGQSFAKLYTAYRGLDIHNYAETLDSFSPDDVCKLNLYPIAFRHTGPELWHQHGFDKTTGFADKELYRIWCFFNRFPWYAELAKEQRPRLIICTGVSYLTEFIACFAGQRGMTSELNVGKLEPKSESNQKPRHFYWAKINSDTTLAVIPFFSGSNGLNSYHLLDQMGRRLREIVGVK